MSKQWVTYRLWVFLWIVSALSLYSQDFFEVDQTIGMKEGLPHDYVTAIVKDPIGFMWIGTANGLSRWDGITTKVFEHNPQDSTSISGNYIASGALCLDVSTNSLIIGTENGISFFDLGNSTFRNIFINTDSPAGLLSEPYSVTIDRQNEIWIGSPAGIAKYDRTHHTFKYYTYRYGKPVGLFVDQEKIDNIYSVTQDIQNDSILWAGTLAGLLKFNKYSQVFEWFYYKTGPYSRDMNSFTSIVAHSNKKLYIGTWNTDMVVFNTINEKFESHFGASNKDKPQPSQITPCFEKSGNELWVSSNLGIGSFNTETCRTGYIKAIENPAGMGSILRISYVDENKTLWVASERGVIVVNIARDNYLKRFQNYFFEPIDKEHWFLPNTVWEDTVNSKLFIGYANGQGLHYFDLKSRTFHYINYPRRLFDESVIRRIIPLTSGTVLVLSLDEIFILSEDRTKLIPLNVPYNECPMFLDMAIGMDGSIWITSEIFGLMKYNLEQGKLEIVDKCLGYFRGLGQQPSIKEIIIDKYNKVWFRNLESYGCYDIEKDEFAYFGGEKKINVSCFLNSKNDTIWAGTGDGELGYIIPDSADVGIRIKLLIHSDEYVFIQDLEQDEKGNIWLLTNRGVEKLISSKNNTILYNEYQGLVKYDKWANRDATIPGFIAKLSDSRFVVGYRRGIGFFHPDSLEKGGEEFLPYLSSVSLFGKEVIPGPGLFQPTSLDLKYNQNFLSFEYSALSLYHGKDLRFEHKLFGIDRNWDRTSRHFGSYSNLAPGKYTFKVRASSLSYPDVFSETALYVSISLPWWKTWWAFALAGLIVILIVVAIYRYQLMRTLDQREAIRLRELDEFKSRLFTNITHEFRTPLTIISGITEYLLENLKPSLKKHFGGKLKMIDRNSHKLSQLIDQLLDLAKLQRGKLKLNLEHTDIIPFLQYNLASFQSIAETKKIKLVFYNETDTAFMDFDRDKISQIISNLISNAIKFTGENGNVVFHVNKIDHSGKPSLIIKVTDTGTGIANADLPHIFDRFYQADQTPLAKSEGSGIGLALTKELIDLMQGSITVKSEPNRGTEFCVKIPINKNLKPITIEDGDISKEPWSNDLDDNTRKQEKPFVLIIEDNDDVVKYLQLCLNASFNTQWMPDGTKGIEAAFQSIPDIVISDVMMPGLDGFDVCKKLKQDERTSHIPIVLLTAKSTDKDRIEGLSYGADAYLTKPFNKQELLVRLNQLIKIRRQLQKKYSLIKIDTNNINDLSLEDTFLQKARNAIISNLDNSGFDADLLAHKLNMSRSQLYRKLKALTGKSSNLYIRSVRLTHARFMLHNTSLNISEIAYQCGFNNPAWFSRSFKEEFGISPSEEWR